jgi:hypothetical protein
MSFYIWVNTLALGTITVIVLYAFNWAGFLVAGFSVDDHLLIPLLILHAWVSMNIARRFFRCSWAGAAWRTVALLFGLQLALTAYRLLLFTLTLWQLS